jgi:hypothetical protein
LQKNKIKTKMIKRTNILTEICAVHSNNLSSCAEVVLNFRFLAAKLSSQSSFVSETTPLPVSVDVADSVKGQLTKYFAKLQQIPVTESTATSGPGIDPDMDSLSLWEKRTALDLLQPLAQDLTCVPASQAFVERSFSLCSFMTAGRRCHMTRSLEMRVFMKQNKNILLRTGFKM